jgi:hypothetical protein
MDHTSKLDPGTRHLLAQAETSDAEAGPRTVSVFVQGERPFGDEEVSQLRADGAEIQTVAGDVLTAEIALDKLSDLAEHDFVMRVEGSAPLHTEGDAQAPSMPPLADVE